MKNLFLKMKSSFLFLLFVFPLFSRGDFAIRLKYFDTVGSTNVSYSVLGDIPDEDALHDVYMSHRFGVVIHDPSTLSSPNASTSTSWYYSLLNNQINPSGSGNYYTNSPAHYPRVFSLYNVAVSLKSNGYDGPGLDLYATVGRRTCYNVYFPDIIANVFSSTNSIYRSIVISHLSQIQTSVVNIDSGVSSLVPSVDRIVDVNSSLLGVSSNLLSDVQFVNTNLSSVSSNSFETVNTLLRLSRSFDSSNPLSLSTVTNLIQAAFDSSLISYNKYEDWLSQISDSSMSEDQRHIFYDEVLTTITFANSVYGFFQGLENSLLRDGSTVSDALRSSGSYFNSDVVDSLIGDYPNNRGGLKAVNTRTSIKSQMNSWRDELKNQLNSWKEDLKQDLQDWKTSDERGILNIKQTIEDNFSTDDPRIPGYSNTVPFTAYVTNYVTRPITNTVSDSARGISSNVVDQSRKTRDLLNDKLFDPNAPGVNVRVVYPIYGEDIRAINVHDTALDAYGQALEGLNDSLVGFKGDVNGQWEAWFRRWDSWSPPVSDNIEAIVDILRHWSNGVARLDHELYKDYSNYVHSSSYAVLFDKLAADYPVCYSNLQKFGLSPSSNDGRWWNIVASTLAYDTSMLSYLFEDMVELDNIAHEHLEKSPFQFVRDTLSDMPSKTQIEDWLDSASNSTAQVDSSFYSLSNSLNQVSNSFVSVFRPFRGSFDSPGSAVTFFKLVGSKNGQGDHYVTIPVGDQLDAWRFIRLGISFGLVAVNLLLFPKYLLMLFTLFIRAYRIGIKFFPDDR